MMLADWLTTEKSYSVLTTLRQLSVGVIWKWLMKNARALRGADLKFDVCFSTIADSASLAKKSRESCQKLVKTNKLATEYREALSKAPLPCFPRLT